MKRLFNLFLAITLIFSFTCVQVYATDGTGGSGNIDGGGGNMGDATSHGSWNPGNEGVRVTIVRSSDHAVVSAPIDLTNKPPAWAVGESPHWSPTMDWMRLDVSGTIYRQMDNWTWEKCLND